MEAARPRERTAADEEAELRELEAPMAAGDAIERMLLAWKDRDYFRRAYRVYVGQGTFQATQSLESAALSRNLRALEGDYFNQA